GTGGPGGGGRRFSISALAAPARRGTGADRTRTLPCVPPTDRARHVATAARLLRGVSLRAFRLRACELRQGIFRHGRLDRTRALLQSRADRARPSRAR